MKKVEKIELTRAQAETLAYSYTAYSTLLTAITLWPDETTFVIYGNKWAVKHDLENA